MSGSQSPAARRRARRIHRNNGRHKRRTPSGGSRIAAVIFFLFVLVIFVAGSIIYIKKYAPTTERLALDDYYTYLHEDEAALVINDTYIEPEEEAACGKAIVRDGELYIHRDTLKASIDDGYVFDDEESILSYATDSDIIRVPYDSTGYTINDQASDWEQQIVLLEYDQVFVSADWARQFSDFSYTLSEDPYHASIFTAGFTHNTAPLRHKSAIRRLGGPKSKIVKIGKRKETVSIIKNHGKWTQIATEDGIIGFVKNRQLGTESETTVEATLPERTYNHKSLDKRVTLAWHMTTSQAANEGVDKLLAQTSGVDVISPTWFHINDNSGGINDNSSGEYVKTCHNKDIQVWGLASDIEDSSVDVTEVLCRTSHRDKLVDNLVNAAISCGMDGFNIDFEHVPADVADGYAQFIRELSIRCEKNDLFLSVDNYVPAAYNAYYNRPVQADYADYVMVMAYDEYYSGQDEAGSVASIPFVHDGVENTLKEVPANQTIQGIPFFCREWIEDDGSLSSNSMGMNEVSDYLSKTKASVEWDEDLGQNYAEYVKDGKKHMLWIEDERSLEKKLDVMKEFDLAGAAFWRLGYETEDAWTVIGRYE